MGPRSRNQSRFPGSPQECRAHGRRSVAAINMIASNGRSRQMRPINPLFQISPICRPCLAGYTSFVIDAFARRIVGTRVSSSTYADFVLDDRCARQLDRTDALIHRQVRKNSPSRPSQPNLNYVTWTKPGGQCADENYRCKKAGAEEPNDGHKTCNLTT